MSTSARLMESKYSSGASRREASSRGTSQPSPSKAKNAPAWAGSRWSAPTEASRPGTL
ncbi:hypothetical protein ACWGCP_15495 [Streptomyces niveus]